MKHIDVMKLTWKYWLQGDNIVRAYNYAKIIVYGFRRQ